MMALGIATALVVAGVALPGRLPTPKEDHAAPLQLQNEPAPAAAIAQPLPPTPVPQASVSASAAVSPVRVSKPATKTLAPKPHDNRPVEPAKAAGTVAAVTTPAEPEPARSATPAPAATVGPPPVTITGCLEMSVDETEFRLTDTEGVQAPKSRSWRTGFLKKHSSPIALVELPDAHALQAQVGKRVAATGVLASGSMKLSALRVVTPSCD